MCLCNQLIISTRKTGAVVQFYPVLHSRLGKRHSARIFARASCSTGPTTCADCMSASLHHATTWLAAFVTSKTLFLRSNHWAPLTQISTLSSVPSVPVRDVPRAQQWPDSLAASLFYSDTCLFTNLINNHFSCVFERQSRAEIWRLQNFS